MLHCPQSPTNVHGWVSVRGCRPCAGCCEWRRQHTTSVSKEHRWCRASRFPLKKWNEATRWRSGLLGLSCFQSKYRCTWSGKENFSALKFQYCAKIVRKSLHGSFNSRNSIKRFSTATLPTQPTGVSISSTAGFQGDLALNLWTQLLRFTTLFITCHIRYSELL